MPAEAAAGGEGSRPTVSAGGEHGVVDPAGAAGRGEGVVTAEAAFGFGGEVVVELAGYQLVLHTEQVHLQHQLQTTVAVLALLCELLHASDPFHVWQDPCCGDVLVLDGEGLGWGDGGRNDGL